ncbi:MAG: hypothetical protein ACE5H3_05280 [Planctomycetota bacterium]
MKGWVSVLILAAIVWAAYHSILSLGLVGHDTYPIVATSRFDNPDGLAGPVSRKLMAGLYDSDFYRPLLNLLVGTEFALWGLAPLGYQIVNLILLLGCALALFRLAERLNGPDARLAPVLSALIFLLFPLQYEVVPVLSRRPETMSCLFAALALSATLSPRSLARGRPALLPGILALAAAFSKETALLLFPLAFLAVLLQSPRPGTRKRLAHAALGTIPYLTAAALALGVRFLVIGGLGGHAEEGLGNLGRAAAMARRLIFPQKIMEASPNAALLVAALGASFVVTGILWLRRRNRLDPSVLFQGGKRLRAALFGLAWTVLMLLLHAWSGKTSAWYYLFPAAGFALLSGSMLEAFLQNARPFGRLPLRMVSSLAALLLLILLGWQASYSPLFHAYPEWKEADAMRSQALEKLEAEIDRAPEGSVLGPYELPVLVARWKVPGFQGPMLYGASILRTYSVQGWAKLRFPDRNVVVVSFFPGMKTTRGIPDQTQVFLEEHLILPKFTSQPQPPSRSGPSRPPGDGG